MDITTFVSPNQHPVLHDHLSMNLPQLLFYKDSSNNVPAVGRSMHAEGSQMRRNTALQRCAAAVSRQDQARACTATSDFENVFH